jgi:hypothetical protein
MTDLQRPEGQGATVHGANSDLGRGASCGAAQRTGEALVMQLTSVRSATDDLSARIRTDRWGLYKPPVRQSADGTAAARRGDSTITPPRRFSP